MAQDTETRLVFSDQPHVEKIREALWCGREFGRAVVMVGSGFSRNSVPKADADHMPVWSDLTRAMGTELGYAQGRAPADVVRLAAEYEEYLSRPELDRLLARLIPDLQHNPGPLHRLLLSLPWAEVLTTNYDTLLERSAETVTSRRYLPVLTPQDIAQAMRPRIVKLHGSFPSVRPFIVTEEDFRTYPMQFAPFVNLTQQAMMENVCCLLGFSGDDPNFLYWAGWVRDHLGPAAPKIYLCGLLSLTGPQRRLLARRNVTPIDLQPLFPEDQYPDREERHRSATEWFLRSLEAGRPYEPTLWPNPPVPPPPPSVRMPASLPPSWQDLRAEAEPSGEVTAETLSELAARWEVNRLAYPGWVIAPAQVRDRVWRATERWIFIITDNISKIGEVERLRVFSELDWRLEVSLFPFFLLVADAVEDALARVDPFPGHDVWGGTPPDGISPVALGTGEGEARRHWCGLAASLLRFYREEQQPEPVRLWTERLGRVPTLPPEVGCRVAYENLLDALTRLDDPAAREALARWPASCPDPIWELRKAAVLAELGEIDQAKRLCEDALAEIRSGLGHSPGSIGMLSREGCAMTLLRYLKGASHEPDWDTPRSTGEFDRLSKWSCNPLDSAREFERLLKGPVPVKESNPAERAGFQPGTVSRTYSLIPGPEPELVPAYQAVRFSETAPYPPRVGRTVVQRTMWKNGAEWFSPYDWVRTRSLLFRLCDAKFVDEVLSRHRVASLTDEEIAAIFTAAFRAYSWSFSVAKDVTDRRFRSTESAERAVGVMLTSVTLLARVAIRTSGEELAGLWEAGQGLYRSAVVKSNPELTKALDELFQSLAWASPRVQLATRVMELLSLPVPGSPELPVPHSEIWPEIGVFVVSRLGSEAPDPEPGRDARLIERLLSLVAAESPFRYRAVVRLQVLQSWGRMSKEQEEQFANSLWDSADAETGLPNVPGLPDYVFLELPEPRKNRSMKAFRTWAARGVPDAADDTSPSLDHVPTLAQEWVAATEPRSEWRKSPSRRYVRWNQRELTRMFPTIRHWWEGTARERIGRLREQPLQQAFLGPFPENQLNNLWSALSEVFAPRVKRDSPLARQIIQFIRAVESEDVPVAGASTVLLELGAEVPEVVASRLRRGLASPGGFPLIDACRGVFRWLEISALDGDSGPPIPPPPADLVEELGSAVAWRREPGLLRVMETARDVLRFFPERATERFRDGLRVGLEYLRTEAVYSPHPRPDDRFSYDSIPALRRLCVEIAARLHDMGDSSPPVEEWREAGTSDPLPEVRQAAQPAQSDR